MSQQYKPEEITLSNGIPVILQHFDGPVGTFHWWNKVGSTDETAPEAGFAHFLEHMLFKDAGAKETGQASTGQTARVIESLGGEINAYTTFDQTVYHVTCSEQYWEKIIDQFAIMAKPQKFLKQDFEREREVILEELRRGEDSPDRQLYQELFTLTYKKHPYGRPVIGFAKILKAATVQKLEAFYKRHYVSSQMGLVLVGPINDAKGIRRKKLIAILEKRFGKATIAKKQAPTRVRPTETLVQPNARYLAKHFDIKAPQAAVSFRIPDLKHTDVAMLEVLSGVLGMGESSRLYQKLFYEKALVTDVSTSVYVPNDPGMFIFSAEPKRTEDLQAVFDAFVEEVEAVRRGEVTKEEIARIVTNIESEKLYSTQTVDGLAGRLGSLKYSLGDLHFDHEYLEQIKSATPATLKRIAETYLTPERMSMVLFQPKGEAAYTFKNIDASAKRLSMPVAKIEKVKAKTKKEFIEPEILTTPSGLKVAYFERPGTPVFSLYASAYGGTRSELTLDPKYWGASHLLSQTWAKGTPRYNSKQISQIIEGSAASLDGFSGRNTVGLQSTGLVRDWSKLTDLFLETLVTPTFLDDELSHAKRVTEEMIKSIPDHSSQVCSKLFMENLFVNHPYGKHQLGTLEQMHSLESKHLKELHDLFVNPKNMSLSIVGGVTRDEMETFLNQVDQELSKRKSTYTMKPLSSESPLTAPRWANASFNREQTHIMMGGTGLSMFDDERYALRILQNILGGQSGRLFIELREKKSMAYTVSPMSMEGLEAGYVGTYIACAPQKADEAVAGMKQVIETLVKKGPTKAEMLRAKNYYLGQRAMDLQSTWSLAAGFGLELLYRDRVLLESEIRKEIERVNEKHVQKIGEKLLVASPMLTVTVG
jgi:zinc protease